MQLRLAFSLRTNALKMSVAYGRFTAALGVLEEKWLGSVNFYILKKLFEGFEDTNKKYAVFKRGTKEAV